MAHERALRMVTLLASALATPLLIATTVVSLKVENDWYWGGSREVTTFCFAYIPLALSCLAAAISLLHHRRHGQMPGPRFALLDCFTGTFYLAILLPIWILEVGRLGAPGYGLLVGYLTAPMIINMHYFRLVHFFIFIYNVQSVWASLASIGIHKCPHCHGNYVVADPQVKQAGKGLAGYSLLRGEDYLDADADAVNYTDARPSEDMIRPDAEDTKMEAKGKAVLDV
ncbi:hypothetical protein T440DRAFT_460717 [Plenodomus tracheiphilus IPT5]|uniref:MARVEL domain-containing protein n=1 Tax=Plenodomus tracheiphilus IPT5 TaxID=1408161 RepID=A0A6A7AS84_9PLEO|nr:hypothetical protein T440DRAFT_460717 [Plenodomus tracheiphilus IPT5]